MSEELSMSEEVCMPEEVCNDYGFISKMFNLYKEKEDIFKRIEDDYLNLEDKLPRNKLIGITPHKLNSDDIIKIQPMANPYEILIDLRSPLLDKIPYKEEIIDSRRTRFIDCRAGIDREGKATTKYLRPPRTQQSYFEETFTEDIEYHFDPSDFANTETNSVDVNSYLSSNSKTSIDFSNLSDVTIDEVYNVTKSIGIDLQGSTSSNHNVETNPHIIDLQNEFDELFENLPLIPNSELEANISTNGQSISFNSSAHEDTSTNGKYEYAVMVCINNICPDFERIRPRLAHIWSFELDSFQKHAIAFLEDRQSVLVSAHTSAGKTVVAEYAIALALKHMTRVVYTSPVKALSNQKFRQFKKTFSDVGIITGDVQVNRTASCLVMTTEILRSMLFNGDRIINNLEYVIFDEVHYINDSQRGVVWEEVLILLPNYVVVVLLSASVPNAMDFAEWVGSIKKRKVFVVETKKRPVPLEHYLYSYVPLRDEHFILLKNETNKKFDHVECFRTLNYIESKKKFQHDWPKLIKMVSNMNDTPMVIFCFSKKRIRKITFFLSRQISLTTTGQQHRILVFFNKCLQRLKECDREIPQINYMRDLLKSGIGVHHSGILPILKECVEMLFECGLVKVLFATDTFSMGVNMPAKTVFFESIKKFQGSGFRPLVPGEYLQMAGRAGRRGMDTVGKVIISTNPPMPEPEILYGYVTGSASPLQSRFRLTYGTLLNLLKTGSMNVEDIIKLSFSDFGVRTCLVKLGIEIKFLEGIKHDNRSVTNCRTCTKDIKQFIAAFEDYSEKFSDFLFYASSSSSLFVPGRIIIVKLRNRYCLGLLLNSPIYKSTGDSPQIVSLLFPPTMNPNMCSPVYDGCVKYFNTNTIPTVNSSSVKNVVWISDSVLKIPTSSIAKSFRKGGSSCPEVVRATKAVYEYAASCNFTIPFIRKVVRDTVLKLRIQDLRRYQRSLQEFECTGCSSFGNHYKSMLKYMENERKLSVSREEYRNQDEALNSEYNSRLEVLKTLNYVSSSGVVEIKGNFARILNHMELFITELAVSGFFSNLDPPFIAALMSIMIYEGKCKRDIYSRFYNEHTTMDCLASSLDRLQDEMNVVNQYEYIAPRLNLGLFDVVLLWARGESFSRIMNRTEEDEGTVVRCIQRVHETLLDLHSACRSVGDFSLSAKVLEASRIINRDIVFTPSLYVE